jgi:hypothetical protein
MKKSKSKIRKLILATGCWLLVTLALTAPALAVVTPANSVINPSTDAVYVPENSSTPGIRIYKAYLSGGPYWREETLKRISLEAKSYGMAVWMKEDGTQGKLLVTISNGTSSKLREYALDAAGMPATSYADTDISALGTSPMGVAILSTGDRAYVADAGNGRLYYYKIVGGHWQQASYVVTDYNVYGIALTPAQNTYYYIINPITHRMEQVLGTSTYKIFVTVKGSSGKIKVFDYNYSGGTETITPAGDITGLIQPTYVKVGPLGDKLFVAVNGASGGDIKIFDITTTAPYLSNMRTISSISGAYGWTGFCVSPSGNHLYFTQVQNVYGTQTKVYKVDLPVSADTSGTEIALENVNSDGLVGNIFDEKLGLTYSGDGSLIIVDTGTHNEVPNLPTGLQQFVYPEGVTPIPEGGTTNRNKIVVQFTVSDPDGGMLTPLIQVNPISPPRSPLHIELSPVLSGTTVVATIPVSSVFQDGGYAWSVSARDAAGLRSGEVAFGDGSLSTVDFVVATVSPNPPNAFSKTSPADGADECCDVSLNWENNGDPDTIDTLTYSVEVFRAGDYTTAVYSRSGITTNSQAIPLGTLTTGETYEWNVSATDGTHIVWANGLRTARWSFNYILGNEIVGDPYITYTSPVDEATDVNTDASMVVRFNESILASSLSVSSTPSITITGREWNSDHTQVTIHHDNFAASTAYNVTIAATDLAGNALNNADSRAVPNPFNFTTGTGTSTEEPVVNVVITREGDNPGDPITFTWDTVPPGAGVDIYAQTCRIDSTSGDYTSYFTTDTTQWTRIAENVIIGTYTDRAPEAQVGAGTARYYKIILNGTTLSTTDLTRNVYGKFDIAVGPSETEPQKFFISIPLEQSGPALTSVIGGQVNEMDMILEFDIDKNVTAGSMFQSGSWVIFPGAPASIDNVELGKTYGYITGTARYITAVGKVHDSDFSLTLTGPMTANWIASPYPVPIPIASAGLNDSSYSTNPVNAATVFHFDANAEVIGGTDGMAFHYDASVWREGTLTTDSPLNLVPGKGYLLMEPTKSSFNWNLIRPY